MKKKLISLLAVIALVMAVANTALAQNADDDAEKLHTMGLYNGISPETFDPDLDAALDYQTAVVLLIRLVGLEDEALAMDPDEVRDALAGQAQLADWAASYVAVAKKMGYIDPNEGFRYFGKLRADQFGTILLKVLGCDPDSDNPLQQLTEAGGLTKEQAQLYADKELTKGDATVISFGALNAKLPSGERLISKLVDEDVVGLNAAVGTGAMNGVISDLIAQYENAPLVTYADIQAAKDLRKQIEEYLAMMPEGEDKTAFEERIEAQDRKIQSVLDYYSNPPTPAATPPSGNQP